MAGTQNERTLVQGDTPNEGSCAQSDGEGLFVQPREFLCRRLYLCKAASPSRTSALQVGGGSVAVRAVEEALEQDLRREHVALGLPLFRVELGFFEQLIGLRGRVALVEVTDGQVGRFAGPAAEGPGFPGLLPFVAAHVDGKADDESDDGVFTHLLLEIPRVLPLVTALVGFDGGGDRLVGIADRDAEALGAVVES